MEGRIGQSAVRRQHRTPDCKMKTGYLFTRSLQFAEPQKAGTLQ